MNFRCEKMALCQVVLHVDTAFNCIAEIGELGMAQFQDVNLDLPPHKMKYLPEIRRCEALERKLGYLMHVIKQNNITIEDQNTIIEASSDPMITKIEMKIDEIEKEVRLVNMNLELLMRSFANLTQIQYFLKKTQTAFEQAESCGIPNFTLKEKQNRSSANEASNILHFNITESSSFEPIRISSLINSKKTLDKGNLPGLKVLTGVILTSKLPAFEKILFRVSMGNIYIKRSEIEVPIVSWNSQETFSKTVFIAFLQGDMMLNKALKVCEGFSVDLYICPESPEVRKTMAKEVVTKLEDLKIVLSQTRDRLTTLLHDAADQLNFWTISVLKTKAVYFTMNKLKYDVVKNMLIGEFWCPQSEVDNVKASFDAGTKKSGVSESSAIMKQIPSNENFPTYHKTNKFTRPIQNIIDAYGIASYMEINPAIFSIISFPFIFSLMFGDMGHGIVITTFALFLIMYENRLAISLKKSDFEMIFTARYLLLTIGIFTIYSGLLNNDLFCKSIIFGKSDWNHTDVTIDEHYDTTKFSLSSPHIRSKIPYSLGIDPLWNQSRTKVRFMNSFRMKGSVILGFFHMMFGIAIKLLNKKLSNRWADIFCMVIPEIIFLLSTFGYLVALIYHKWIYYDATTSAEAPALLVGFINMFLMKYPENVAPPFAVSKEKKTLQITLVVIALLCVPWMLLAKPYVLYRRIKKKHFINISNSAVSSRSIRAEDLGMFICFDGYDRLNKSNSSNEEDGSFTDIFINQCIHTMEFCLGCISHIASYLRIWALSLAHGQLNDVIWDSTLKFSLTTKGPKILLLTFSFFMWVSATVLVLLCMEFLSVFLHTLRLHWIEFMSKFYEGEGHAFKPFILSNIDMSLLEMRMDSKKTKFVANQ